MIIDTQRPFGGDNELDDGLAQFGGLRIQDSPGVMTTATIIPQPQQQRRFRRKSGRWHNSIVPKRYRRLSPPSVVVSPVVVLGNGGVGNNVGIGGIGGGCGGTSNHHPGCCWTGCSAGGGFVALPAPRPLVLCGPSGSGKSTLLKKLMEEFGDCLGFSVSHTTRSPRNGEMNGREYHFVSRDDMIEQIKNGEFIEYTEFSTNFYGTSKKAVKEVQDKGKICILDVEVEGVQNLKKTDLNPRFVFVKAPSLEILEQRLRGRGTESEESVLKRLRRATDELAYGESPGHFDIVIVNDDLHEAYKALREFLLQDIEMVKKSRGM